MRIEAYNSDSTTDCDLVFLFCGYEECIPNFKSIIHTRDYYIIHYVVRGSGYYSSNNIVHSINPCDVFAILPGQIVSYNAPDPDDPWSFYWFAFLGKKASDYLLHLGFSESTPIISLHAKNTLADNINSCIKIIGSDKNSHFNITGSLYNLLYEIEKNNLSPLLITRTKTSDSQRYIDLARMHIVVNYMNNISVDSISQFIGLERTYFSKLFRKYTGMSPRHYIIQYRIEKAKTFLLSGNMRIKEISTSVGISDPYYFSRIFKKITGLSPTQYIKSKSR